MTSIVAELQRDALNNNVSISNLLRKSLVVARKLKINELEKWVLSELNGYSQTEEIPDYRWATGIVKAFNPFHGWQPVIFPNDEMAAAASRKPNAQTIAEIESLLEDDDGDSKFFMKFPASLENKLREAIRSNTDISLFFPRTDLVKIVDAIRNIILNWAIKLEEDGIIGEGLSFTSDEKKVATQTEYNITNFYAPIENSQIQQQTKDSIQIKKSVQFDLKSITEFIIEVRECVKQLGLEGDEEKELESELISVEAQIKSPKPKNLIINEGMKTIRTILEGAGGGIAANLLSRLAEIMF